MNDSYYFTVELTGEAAQLFFSNENIEQLKITSASSTSDLISTNNMKEFVNQIFTDLDDDHTLESDKKVAFNPIFYENRDYKISEIKTDAEEQEDILSEEAEAEGRIVLLLTNDFDEEGDNICSRWHLSNEFFSISAKIYQDIDFFMRNKAVKKLSYRDQALSYTEFPKNFIN